MHLLPPKYIIIIAIGIIFLSSADKEIQRGQFQVGDIIIGWPALWLQFSES